MGLYSHWKLGHLATKGQEEIKHGLASPKLLASGSGVYPSVIGPHEEKAAITLPARWPGWIPH